MKKILSVLITLLILFTTAVPCAFAADEYTVAEVEEMLEAIDTLEQIQSKRSSYTAKSHYDLNTTKTSIITAHQTARNGYETYVSDMFAQRAAAQQAYDSLTDEQKAEVDSELVAKLDSTLSNSFLTGECSVTPRDDEYSFEAVNFAIGFAYEVSNHMISGSIPQSFILVDTSDGKTSWSPTEGEYVYGESNYIVTYCCDKETGLEYSTDYKRVNLEDSEYFDTDEAQRIRAIVENSYPFITMDEMKSRLIANGADADFVNTLTRADMIAGVQMAIWSYANINDAAADGLEYFASIDIPKNIGIYFTPLHDYTNEVWDWLPGKRQRTFDSDAAYRVNTLGELLNNLEALSAQADQVVISELQVVRTELVSYNDGVYDITVYVTLNGGGDERDELNITATAYSENEDGTVTVTDSRTQKAVRNEDCYSIDISVKDADTVKVTIDGKQYLAKGVYFYDPEGGRDTSQSLVGVSEGYTAVKAEKEIIFTEPEYTIIAPDEIEVTIDENTVLKTEVIPEIGAPAVLYTSSDESVVKIDESGNIEAVGLGTATITAYLDGDETNMVTITVNVVLPSYKIETPEALEVTEGETQQIDIKITPDDGRLTPVFSSEDESIATVDQNGIVTGVAEGTTNIRIDFGNGEIRLVPVTVIAPASTVVPVVPSVPKKHYICFGKTDGIGWYEVSVNGGDTIIQGPNSTLEVEEGSVLVVRVQDMWIDDEFDFYVNGERYEGVANTLTVVVDGYMLIGALSMDTDVPDIEESLNIFQKLIKLFEDFFNWIKGLFNF